MPPCERYETIEPPHNGRFRSRHRTLDREVEVVCIAGDSWSGRRHADFLELVSRMANLDHPCLPHLIDLQQVDGGYHIILESTVAEEACDAPETLELVSRLSQAADALAHAQTHQIAHGSLSNNGFRCDELGNLKIVGIGILQCREQQTFAELASRDLRDLSQRMVAVARPALTHATDVEESAKLRELLDIAEEFAISPQANEMHELNALVRVWMQDAVARRQAKRLEVGHQKLPRKPQSAGSHRWRTGVLVLGGICLLMLLFWLETMRPVEPPPLPGTPIPAETHPQRLPVTSSELAHVGVINNPDAEQPATRAAHEDKPARESSSANAGASPTQTNDKPNEDVPKTRRRVHPVRRNPFEDLSRAIALPARDATTPAPLIGFQLPGDVRLRVELLGGVGAGRQVEFSLVWDAAGESAIMTLERREASTAVARLDRVPTGLEFQWLPAAAEIAAADFLQNTVIQLSVPPWKEGFALREAVISPALRADLERKKPYDMNIPAPPEMEDVFIEFVPPADGVTKALPSNEMPALDGVMRLGLDAGQNSKVVLLVESLLRSRRKLRLTGLARLTEEAVWVPVQAGAATQLRNDLLASTLALKKMRAQVDHVKDKDQKAAMRLAMRATTHKLEVLRRFKSSFAEAQGKPLHFRIYRRVEGYRVPLLEFKDVEVAHEPRETSAI